MNGVHAVKLSQSRSVVLCAAWCCVSVSISGCQGMGGSTTTDGGQGPPASPVQHALLQNIPLPVGFEMVPERSVAHESGQLRVAQCEFEGSAAPEQVSRFYISHMPSARFTLKQKRFDNGEYALRFESAAEECNVRVRGGRMKTTLVIDISPLPKGSADRKPTHAGYEP